MECPDYNVVVAFAEGTISSEDRSDLQVHLDQCPTCFALVVDLAQDSDPDDSGQHELPKTSMGPDTVAVHALSEPSLSEPSPSAPEPRATPAGRSFCPAGTLFDHFRVIRLLGRGGMGEVYLARDQQLGRKVALKVVRADRLGSQESVDRFLFEAQTTARFNHPHIVTIYAVGQVDGTPYVALEYLEGQNLAERISEQPLSLFEGLRICLAIAQAIHEAHSHGVMHRDLKPANILLPTDGRVRVVDFGLAYALETAGGGKKHPADAQGTGKVHGTPMYMAPEQWIGEVTQTTDVWGIGLILYELIAGQLPWHLESPMGVMLMMTNAAPFVLGDELGDAPPGISELIRDCLQKSPRARPTTAQVVERLMEHVYEGRRHTHEGESPFRGLLAFAERHADYFFGRDTETAACTERLRQEPILAIVGPSGVGKSSFVQAGVIPRLRELSRWVVLRIRPADDPLRRLASKIVAIMAGETGSNPVAFSDEHPARDKSGTNDSRSRSEHVNDLHETLRKRPRMVNVYLQELARQRNARVLLLVDQMEEVFTLNRNDEDQAAFIEAVCAASDDPADPVRTIFTLRDDFLGVWASTSIQAQEVLRHVVVLQSPDEATLREVLTRPLAIAGHTFDDPSLVDDIIDSVDPSTSLPLVQFTARTLWDMRDPLGRVLRRSDYEAIGGVEGALASHAEEVLLGLTLSEFDTARALCLRLVTPDRTRRIMSESLLIDGLDPEAGSVLERLTKSRLLAAGRAEEEGDAQVELAHESLIHSWPTLARWVSEGKDELAFLNDAIQAAELWDRRGRNNSELWEGIALLDAQRSRKNATTGMPTLVDDFLIASEEGAVRRRRRRRFWAAALPAILSIVVLVVSLQKLEADEQRDDARHQKVLVEEARVMAESARSRAMIGEVEALMGSASADHQARRLLQARAKLRSAAERSPDVGLALRSLWWRLSEDPLRWSHTLGAIPYAAAWDPKNDRFAVAVQDRAVYLFEGPARTLRLVRGHADQVTTVTLSPDGTMMASGDAKGDIQMTALDHGSDPTKWRGHKTVVVSLSFSPDSRLLASGGATGTVAIWDAKTRALKRRFETTGRIRSVTFSGDGRWLAAQGTDAVYYWDRDADWRMQLLKEIKPGLGSVYFHPVQPWLAIGYASGEVNLIDMSAVQEARLFEGRKGEVTSLRFSADGRKLGAAGAGELVSLWDVESGKLNWTLPGREGAAVLGLAIAPDGEELVTASTDRLIRLYRTDMRPSRQGAPGHSDAVYGVSISPEGTFLVSTSIDGIICLWDTATGRARHCFAGETKGLGALDIHPLGDRIAYGGWDGVVRIRSIESNAVVSLWGHKGTVNDLCFSPDGHFLATGGDDGVVRVWDVKTHQEVHAFKEESGKVMGVNFSDDGSQVVAGSSNGVVGVWNITTGKRLHTLRGHEGPVLAVSFLDKDTRLATGGFDAKIKMWDLKTGDSVPGPTIEGRVYRIRPSPSNQELSIATSMPFVQVTERTGKPIARLRGHTRDTNAVAYSDDGQLLASVGDDGTVRLWNMSDRSPTWFTSALVHSPVRLFSHEGQSLLQGRGKPAEETVATWEKRLQAGRAEGVMSEDGALVCIRDGVDDVAFWSTGEDRAIGRLEANVVDMLPLRSGCLLRSAQGAWVVDGLGKATALAFTGTPQALGVGLGDALVATKRSVFRFSPAGALVDSLNVSGEVTGLSLTVGQSKTTFWVLGFSEGNVELRTLDGARRNLTFQGVPSSPVARVTSGPGGTLIMGYGDGTVGLWSLDDGSLIKSHRLHGGIKFLLSRGEQLYVASDLGAHLTWNLEAFTMGRCSLLAQIWKDTHVVWQDGQVVAQAPPKTDPCLSPPTDGAR